MMQDTRTTEEYKMLEMWGNYLATKHRQIDDAFNARDKAIADYGELVKEVLEVVSTYLFQQNPKSSKNTAAREIWDALYVKYAGQFLDNVCPQCRAKVSGKLAAHKCPVD